MNTNYEEHSHSHCWEEKNPPCGQKIKHFACCLCEKPHPDIQALLKEQLEEERTKISLSPKTQLDETENADTYEEGYEQCLGDVLSLLSDKPEHHD